ncbi:hypothetical protein BS50DRAFT_579689 [Corynespora cassiicola Philippines]|uniref:DUF7703 domain-containing protein n=1 Tax=Corynespora cassiicola Philippines TaxID=1448308 RepID=A0A2T2N3Q2_CORCC|nr:hypothetical protein BS50DRAFT_579689 [Corynespora cassiicola Philippines]
MPSPVSNITVPWVPLADFDWSFARSGPLPWNQTVWSIIAVFTALPVWMTVELTVWIFYTFKRYSGLYFWSVLACTWGTTIHAIGFVLKFCVPQCNWIFSTVLAEIGWVGMVTGFSVVLYSRLRIVIGTSLPDRVIKLILAMIITDAFLFHVPTIVFQFGVSNSGTHEKFLPYMAPMERVQVMAFSIQEIIISGVYIYSSYAQRHETLHNGMGKTVMLLLWVQVIVILCDVVVIVLDYCEYFTLKAVLHSFVYAFKLQLEFVILNDLKARAEKPNFGLAPLEISHIHGGLGDREPNRLEFAPKSGVQNLWSSTFPPTPSSEPTSTETIPG